ncbi:MAG: DUF3445 domain-containing protein [Akkermansiaceae bacterium]|nr:DUF3445 domain-containing protein [Akkermansiaceae bacterium]
MGRRRVPFWKGLFVPGEFGWTFRMRPGDAESFFAPQDESGRLLAEKRKWLDADGGLYTAVTPPGEPLVAALWDLAREWGHVSRPEDGSRSLLELARRWEPDILLVDAETVTVAAGCVCFPSSWSLQSAAGKRVHEVHGLVPRLNAQIGGKIDRFLSRLQPGKAYRRENWGVTRSPERNYHPDLGRPRLDATVTLGELFLRVEQQVFTSLPGGVLMGIRIETCPLADLAADPEAWNAFAEKVRTMPDDVAVYKGMLSAQDAIVREMEKFAPLRG